MMNWSNELPGVLTDVSFWWLGIENPDNPPEEVADLSLEVSSKMRTVAILALLGKASTTGFVHSCTRAARARKIFLTRLADAGIDQHHHRVSGCYEPLLDAIAAGDMALVREINRLSPGEFRPPDEYEDDYCYAQILQRLCQDSVPEIELKPLLERFEIYLDGDYNPRLPICKALVEKNETSFVKAFKEFLEAIADDIQKNIARGQPEDVHVLARRHVSVEGLAILRLADNRGIPTDKEYMYCPSLARLSPNRPCPDP